MPTSFLATSMNNLQPSIRILPEKYCGRVGGWLRFRIATHRPAASQSIWAAACPNFELLNIASFASPVKSIFGRYSPVRTETVFQVTPFLCFTPAMGTLEPCRL